MKNKLFKMGQKYYRINEPIERLAIKRHGRKLKEGGYNLFDDYISES